MAGPSGRFAPSPTGDLHLGNLRTALAAWLFARSSGGEFLLRFEDLDERAVVPESYETQQDDLKVLGIDWDGDPVRQSERLETYESALAELLAAGLLYPCFCSRREIREAASAPNRAHAGHLYPGTCRDLSASERSRRAESRPPALRVRGGGETVTFDDIIAGPQEFTVDDFVVQRNDGTVAYHLAVVVDDADSEIGLVVRADDLLESTARHLLLYRFFYWTPPEFAHVPLVLSDDGDRLAKRHGAVTLNDRLSKGETAAQVLAFLASTLNLCESDEEISATTLVERFKPELLPTAPLQLPASFLS